MELRIIVAASENNCIGKNGKLPWPKIPEDIARFKRLTLGKPVIMGRLTYESLPEKFRPLPGRTNIVVSSKNLGEGVLVARTIEEAMQLAFREEVSEGYFIGGKRVYEEALPLVGLIEMTRVKGNFEGDVYFPKLDLNEWVETRRRDYDTYSFVRYEKIVDAD